VDTYESCALTRSKGCPLPTNTLSRRGVVLVHLVLSGEFSGIPKGKHVTNLKGGLIICMVIFRACYVEKWCFVVEVSAFEEMVTKAEKIVMQFDTKVNISHICVEIISIMFRACGLMLIVK